MVIGMIIRGLSIFVSNPKRANSNIIMPLNTANRPQFQTLKGQIQIFGLFFGLLDEKVSNPKRANSNILMFKVLFDHASQSS